MFGEMVGVWAMCLWEHMGQPNKVNLVELGPGIGTLMADLLRGASKFEKFIPALKKIQKKTLKCDDEDGVDTDADKNTASTLTGTPVSWHSTLEEVPTGDFKASRGWCAKMIDVAEDSKFRVVLSPQPTPATLYLLKCCKWAQIEELKNWNMLRFAPKQWI
ncbi:hypothetical protein OROMI_020800 [Orobanche minor]